MSVMNVTLGHIDRAARMNDLDAAALSLQTVAGIVDGGVAALQLSESLWATASYRSRLSMLNDWLAIEAEYEKEGRREKVKPPKGPPHRSRLRPQDALVAWTPGHLDALGANPMAGKVAVGPLLQSDGERDWTEPYECTGGAAEMSWRELKGDEMMIAVMTLFHMLVVQEGLDPQVVHKEFLKIDVYRHKLRRHAE